MYNTRTIKNKNMERITKEELLKRLEVLKNKEEHYQYILDDIQEEISIINNCIRD